MTILLSTPVDGIAQITLNRPEKRNALDAAMIQSFTQTLSKVANDNSVKVVLINGSGTHFCAGADITVMQKMAGSSHEDNVTDAMQLAQLLKNLFHFPKPTVAFVQGAAMGGGVGLAASCDIVLATHDAQFCFSEAKIGLTPSVISPYVIAAIGARAAGYYFLTAELFSAQRAYELGLVQKIVTASNLIDEGLTFAETLLKNSPFALTEAKKLIHYVKQEAISDSLAQWTAEHLAKMRTSSDAVEGLSAFLEKRTAKWQ